MREAATDVCHHCKRRYSLSRYSNRHKHSGSTIKGRFCSPKCRQAAYRKRVGTNVPRGVTEPLQAIENTAEIQLPKTTIGHRWDADLFSRFGWEDRISSGGVPI